MTKSQLIERIAEQLPAIPRQKVEAIVNAAFDAMSLAMERGERIEIRGFGSFAVKTRPAREGRNPKTGEKVVVPPRRSLTFTVGKELRDRLNPDSPPSSRPVQEAEPERVPVSIAPAPAPSPDHGAQPLAASGPGGPRYTLN